MYRILPTLTLAGLLILAACAPDAVPPEPESTGPPNLLFVITDDQRFDMMGNVTPWVHTPEMDRLAAEGVRFERAYVTTPICAASRASLLTGLVERTHGYTFGTPPLAERFVEASYPTLLRRAGYTTAHIGKFGVNLEPGAADTLFDVFRPLNRNPYFKPTPDGGTRHLTDITADSALAFLARRPADRPFALTLSFNAPHAEDSDPRQYIWPPGADSLYRDGDLPEFPLTDPAFYDALPEFLRDSTLNRVRWHWRFETPAMADSMRRGYLRMLSGVDAALGRVRAELDRLGLADNTVIVLMGDNGYFLGERGYAGKWLPHDLSIHVPLLVYDPRPDGPARPGARPEAPVLNIDVAPTLLDFAGIAVPASMQGRSLVPLLDGEAPDDWRAAFWIEHLMEHPQILKHEGVRGPRFRYSRYFEQTPSREELFDLDADPLETRNLADDPTHAETLARLRARTDSLRDAYGGPYLAPTDR